MTKIPFNEGTKIYETFIILSDGKWHCGKHELPGTQPAKAIQIIRQHGYEIENSTRYCDKCKDKTVHRRLISTEPKHSSFIRINLPFKLRQRIIKYYNCIEAITLQKLTPNMLEIDHRFPQVRWLKDEKYDINMSEEKIHRRFQLLTRQNNLWKSRYCEHCEKTNERGTFIGIDFFYQGNSFWDPKISKYDEKGCFGCFWFDPDKWRKALNKLILEKRQLNKIQ